MIKYFAAATALKAFSINGFTKRLYRRIGNRLGQKARLAVSDLNVRVARGDLLLELCETHDAVRDGYRMLEIGTGWMHWYSLYLRLQYDVRITALDIWDNRQFDALSAAAQKLLLRRKKNPDANQKFQQNLRTVIACRNFEELYEKFGYNYIIEPDGSLSGFSDAEFDFITSFHVLEHVPIGLVQALMTDMFRTLRPGAHTIHQIGIDDHLAHYDRRASPKQYLKYSDTIWKMLFENEVQYVNRLQPSEWTLAFERAGFVPVRKIAKNVNIDGLKINPRFRDYPLDDLMCTNFTVVYQKPENRSV